MASISLSIQPSLRDLPSLVAAYPALPCRATLTKTVLGFRKLGDRDEAHGPLAL